MTWTYDGDPSASDRDWIRHALGDVDENDPLLTDEEIAAELTERADVVAAAVACCDAILARLARQTDRNVAGFTSTRSQATTHYTDVRERLLRRMGRGARVFAAGVSRAGRESIEADPDFIQPRVKRGMDRHQTSTESTPSPWSDAE